MNIHRIANIAKDKDESHRQSKVNKMEKTKVLIEEKAAVSDVYDINAVSAELNKFSSVFDMESFNEVKGMLSAVIDSLTTSGVEISDVVKEFPSEEIINLSKMAFKDDSSTK